MSEAADVEKGGKEMKELEYNCTLIYFANQIGIHLWQAMEMMKYAKLIYEKDRKKIDIAWQLERSKLLEVVEILKSQLAKMREALKEISTLPKSYPIEAIQKRVAQAIATDGTKEGQE